MSVQILQGDCREVLKTLEAESVDCVVTSPPYYGLRSYGDHAGMIGLEPSLGEHLEALVEVFREVRRVLKRSGTCWVNYGDAYACAPNGRSAADTKALGNDGRTFRDKPLNTVGPIVRPSFRRDGASVTPVLQRRAGDDKRGSNSKEGYRPGHDSRIVAGGTLKPKDRMMLPARLAIALCDDGWWLRDEIVWHKPNPMPSSVRDRTTPAHEMIYLLTKSARYFFDQDAIRTPPSEALLKQVFEGYEGEDTKDFAAANAQSASGTKSRIIEGARKKLKVPGGWDKGEGAHGTIHRDGRTEALYVEAQAKLGANKRSVWTVTTEPFDQAHFATFPTTLIEPCIKAGCPVGGVVLDPFAGAGTVGVVADRHQRDATLIEINSEYIEIARTRLSDDRGALLDWLARKNESEAGVAA